MWGCGEYQPLSYLITPLNNQLVVKIYIIKNIHY